MRQTSFPPEDLLHTGCVLLGRVRVADPFPGVPARAEATSNDVSSNMARKSGAPIFYKEVVDAIARNPPHVGDLVVLKDLCSAVDASDKRATSQLTRQLVQLSGVEDPLHGISYELFHALMARMLVEGWFEEFDLLMDWDETLFRTKDERAADKWEGIVKIVTTEPESLRLSKQVDHEKEWQRALKGLEGVIRHFAKVKLPKPSTIGAPPIGPEYYERVLPETLGEAIEQFYRVLDKVEDSYDAEIRPKKKELSLALRGDHKLLLPDVRIVASERLETVLPAVEKVVQHLNEISQPTFKFPRNFVPPFARSDEVLLEVP